jgi:excisionase family DNA binding protein
MRYVAGENSQKERRNAAREDRPKVVQKGSHAGADQVLTSREARQFLRIGRTKLHELTRRQHIPAYRIGRGRTSALRYLRSDLLGWLVRQKI